MDDTDRKLIQLIGANGRIGFGELGKRLGISAQAVHHRIKVLKETGAIRFSTVGISIPYLGAIPVAVFGRSDATSVKETLDKLAESEFTLSAVVASGGQILVTGVLRNISELNSFAEFVRRVTKMPAPTVGIYCLDDGLCRDMPFDGVTKLKKGHKKLTLLDLKIIASLKGDLRRPIAKIADMVGASPKTVRRHLQRMLSDGSLSLDFSGDPTSGGDVEALVHVSLGDGADKMKVGKRLLSRHPLHITYIRSFSNLPNFLLCVFFGNKLAEILKDVKEIGEDPDVVAVTPNISCAFRMYENWRVRLPEKMIAEAKSARSNCAFPALGAR